jgi:hypothetical protein
MENARRCPVANGTTHGGVGLARVGHYVLDGHERLGHQDAAPSSPRRLLSGSWRGLRCVPLGGDHAHPKIRRSALRWACHLAWS